MSTTVRVSDQTHERLAALAAASGERMQTIVENAVAAYEAGAFWNAFTTGYDQLADDPEQWREIEAERSNEAPALSDSLDA
jgi:hypothetical protein